MCSVAQQAVPTAAQMGDCSVALWDAHSVVSKEMRMVEHLVCYLAVLKDVRTVDYLVDCWDELSEEHLVRTKAGNWEVKWVDLMAVSKDVMKAACLESLRVVTMEPDSVAHSVGK